MASLALANHIYLLPRHTHLGAHQAHGLEHGCRLPAHEVDGLHLGEGGGVLDELLLVDGHEHLLRGHLRVVVYLWRLLLVETLQLLSSSLEILRTVGVCLEGRLHLAHRDGREGLRQGLAAKNLGLRQAVDEVVHDELVGLFLRLGCLRLAAGGEGQLEFAFLTRPGGGAGAAPGVGILALGVGPSLRQNSSAQLGASALRVLLAEGAEILLLGRPLD